MANTYTQIYIHLVFAVKNKEALITPELEPELHMMLTSVLQNNRHKMIAINGTKDHVHIFFNLKPHEALSHLVKEMKTATSAWINGNRKVNGHFRWQEGYGAFSYSRSQIEAVSQYVLNQKQHHTKESLYDEYIKMLKAFGVDYDEKYVAEWFK